mmetsp:Transcript_10673/g.25385  ORF Transcript_10673/g.25385 Transcript_10673/m.25385 type:complete len:226 (-) Transcript_10673:1496-2173(-)
MKLFDTLHRGFHLGGIAIGEHPRALLQFLRLLRITLELPSNLLELGLQRSNLVSFGHIFHVHVGLAGRQVHEVTHLLLQHLGDLLRRRALLPPESLALHRRFLFCNLPCSCHLLVGEIHPIRCTLRRLDSLDWVMHGIIDHHPQHLLKNRLLYLHELGVLGQRVFRQLDRVGQIWSRILLLDHLTLPPKLLLPTLLLLCCKPLGTVRCVLNEVVLLVALVGRQLG